MPRKRFVVTLGLLSLSLFALVSGVNAALDRLTQAPVQNSFVVYDEGGRALYAYNGDLNYCPVSIHQTPSVTGPHFLHRT
jgi:hypothetical protein